MNVSFAILGCGSRGSLFSRWIMDNPDVARVLAVAEPVAERRDKLGDRHAVPAELRF